MLGRTNAGSGGGGGLGDNDALLRVTAAENATVTIQLGSGVVRNPNFVRQEFGTSKFYSYFIINNNNFGNYTIRAAVSGSSTKETTQAINQAKVYFVNLASLILYEKGTPYTVASELGAFQCNNYTTTTKIDSTGIILGGNTYGGDAFWFANNINSVLANYTTLNITLGKTSHYVRVGLSSRTNLGFSTGTSIGYDASMRAFDPFADYDPSTSSVTNSIDITSLGGSQYYLAGMIKTTAASGTATITKIELT